MHPSNCHVKTHPYHEGDGSVREKKMGGWGGNGGGGLGVGEKWVNVGLNQLIYLGI